MRLIKGLEPAREFLTRTSTLHGGALNPELSSGIERVFGRKLSVQEAVSRIIRDVAQLGDRAVLNYMRRIDGLDMDNLEVTDAERSDASKNVPGDLMESLKLAAQRIESYQKEARENGLRDYHRDGLGQRVTAINRAGLYVPGGRAIYPSTVLMTAVPARVAGVGEIVLATPPGPEGAVAPVVLAAADIARVDRVFKLGGAQAIAAMALGTETVPAVDKIFGPGNVFVQEAKRQVFGTVGIDTIQGPTEAVLVADDSTNPEGCAADILAQAEHDPQATSILITTSARVASEVDNEVERQLGMASRESILRSSLEANGAIILIATIEQAVHLSNLYAPEHLCLLVRDAGRYVSLVENAGALFLGEDSPHVLGDYVAGPSHALPTAGAARYSSALGVNDFLKVTSVVSLSDREAAPLIGPASTIARSEGLEAHARSVESRTRDAVRRGV